MELLQGKEIAEKIKKAIAGHAAQIAQEEGASPKLVAMIAGDNSGARIYAQSQQKTAQSLGIDYELLDVAESISQEAMEQEIKRLNQDASVTGIILQMPLPNQLDADRLIATLDPRKDVEGIHVDNLGLLVAGRSKMIPCTPQAAFELILRSGVEVRGKEAVVVGASQIVGKPMGLILVNESANTTVVRSPAFKNGTLEGHVRRADILVVAVGKPKIIPGEWIKEGSVVIDIGINRVDGKVVGDVDFETAKERAAFITPVPGGVGPLTVTILMQNVLRAHTWQKESEIA